MALRTHQFKEKYDLWPMRSAKICRVLENYKEKFINKRQKP